MSGAIDFLEELKRIQSQSNLETFDRTTDSLEAISNAVAAIIAGLGQEMRPEIQLYEGWQDELGIDFTLWTLLNPATAWVRGAGVGVAAPHLVATNTMVVTELSRLVGNQRWPIAPDTWGANTILRRVVFEFGMTIDTILSLLNTACFFGFTPNQGDTRASNNIIGFALIGAANDLQTVTDDGAPTVNTIAGVNFAAYNKFRIDILTPLIAGVPTPSVRFYLNEALIATHVTTLPDLPMYPNFYFDTTGGGAVDSQIGIIRIWTEDYQRV